MGSSNKKLTVSSHPTEGSLLSFWLCFLQGVDLDTEHCCNDQCSGKFGRSVGPWVALDAKIDAKNESSSREIRGVRGQSGARTLKQTILIRADPRHRLED